MRGKCLNISKKSGLILFICVAFVLTACAIMKPFESEAASAKLTKDGKFYYEVVSSKTKTARIVDYTGKSTKLTFPSKITGKDKKTYTVVEIGYADEDTYAKLTSVTIPASVKVIDEDAFGGCCGKLTNVTFASGSKCETIGECAFQDAGIKSITIPASVKTIGEEAFAGCEKLTKVTFASGSKCSKIGNCAFSYCGDLKEITIPASVKIIDEDAFESCGLTKVTFASGSKCTKINTYAFTYCTDLKEITIPASVVTIEDSAFYGCLELSKVTFAGTSKCSNISYDAFCNTEVNDIIIPASVKEIGSHAIGYECDEETGEYSPRVSKGVVDIKGDNTVICDDAIAANTVWVNNSTVYNRVCDNCNDAGDVIVRNYTISFYDGNTKMKTTGNIAYNKSILLNSYYKPTKRGYMLTGWRDSDGKIYAVDKTVSKLTETGSTKLYAVWEAKDYTIVYDGNGTDGGSKKSWTVSYDSKIVFSNGNSEFYNTGSNGGRYYPTLIGWCLNKNGTGSVYKIGDTVKVSNLVTSDTQTQIRMYAVWTRTVRYSLKKRNTYILSITDETNKSSYTMPTYESISNRYTTTYKYPSALDTEYAMFTSGDSEYKTYKEGITKKKSQIADFYGWRCMTGGSGFIVSSSIGGYIHSFDDPNWIYIHPSGADNESYSLYKSGETVSLGFMTTAFPAFVYKDITIHFDGGDATGSMADVMCEDGKIKNSDLENKFSRGQQEFVGWGVKYKDTVIQLFRQSQIEDSKSEIYQKAECYRSILRMYLMADDNMEVTLVPMWSGTNTYVVKFNSNGSSSSMSYVELACDTDQTLPACTLSRSGYTFMGWSTSADSDTVAYADGAAINRSYADRDLQLYAVWKPNTYTVKYVANGGVGTMTSGQGETGKDYTVSSNGFERDGAEFVEWSTKADGSGSTYEPGEIMSYEAAKDGETVTLYAIWELNEVKLTFNANGGTVSKSSKTAEYGEKAGKLPTPTREGYTFDGWYTRTKGGNKYTENTKINVSGSITLYAHWKGEKATVTFAANGGKSLSFSSRQVNVGDSIGKLPTVKRDKYEFIGWYTSKEGGTKVSTATKITKRSVKLYARWKAKGRNVSVTIKSVKMVKKAKGCQVQYSSSKSFSNASTITIKRITGSQVSTRVTGLKPGTKYYFRARTYKVVKGKKVYGKWSAVTTKKTSE